MPETGQLLEVSIIDIAFGGSGVAKLESGAVVFVPYSAIGDKLEIKITECKKNFFRGEIQQIIVPSPDRIEPKCCHFGRCGGCVYQHLDYKAELKSKQMQLQSCLKRVGGIQDLPEFDMVVASPLEYGYRNKLRLEPHKPILETDGVHLSYGYCLRDNNTYFTVKECPLAVDVLNKHLASAIHSPWGKQNAKHKPPMPVTLRADAQNNSHFYFGRAPISVTWLKEEIHGKEVSVPLGSFWQVNHAVAESLLKVVAHWVKPLGMETLIDAYSGVGTFSLAMPTGFVERILIESDRQAGEAAKLNHANFQLGCQVIPQRTESVLPNITKQHDMKSTLVVIDPPRSGCQPKVIETLAIRKPAYILYVSCNPATLARDLKKLMLKDGYEICKIGLFDMFPRTAHFESAVLLARKDK
ncbi:MAG: class I SAM-dependent RNA methyltransferase [Lentisphaeria bacterium]